MIFQRFSLLAALLAFAISQSAFSATQAAFETIEAFSEIVTDGGMENQPDLDQMTDDQVEDYYRDAVDLTNSLLERSLTHPQEVLSLLQEDIGMSLNGKGLSGLVCLSIGINSEARGEPYAGKIAVGQTIMSRAGGQASRVCGVLFARAQFENIHNASRKVTAESMRAAKATIGTGGGCGFDHFYSPSLMRKLGRPTPKWVRNFQKWGCAQKTIGSHVFFSSCNCKHRRKELAD